MYLFAMCHGILLSNYNILFKNMTYFSIDKFLNDDMSHMKHEHEECGKKIVKNVLLIFSIK